MHLPTKPLNHFETRNRIMPLLLITLLSKTVRSLRTVALVQHAFLPWACVSGNFLVNRTTNHKCVFLTGFCNRSSLPFCVLICSVLSFHEMTLRSHANIFNYFSFFFLCPFHVDILQGPVIISILFFPYKCSLGNHTYPHDFYCCLGTNFF